MMFQFTTFLFLMTFSAPALGLNPNDVSILLPLPKTTNDSNLLKPEAEARFGPLIAHEEINILAAGLAGWNKVQR